MTGQTEQGIIFHRARTQRMSDPHRRRHPTSEETDHWTCRPHLLFVSRKEGANAGAPRARPEEVTLPCFHGRNESRWISFPCCERRSCPWLWYCSLTGLPPVGKGRSPTPVAPGTGLLTANHVAVDSHGPGGYRVRVLYCMSFLGPREINGSAGLLINQ